VLGLAGAPAVVTAGPSPGSSAIPPGGSVSFAWTVSTAGLGLLDLTAWGAGTDADTGWLVQSPAAGATVLVQGRARLAIESFIAGPRPCGAGQPVTATLVVRNIGGVNAVVDGVFPGVLPSPAGTAGPSGAVAPAAPFTVAPGASVTFTWTVPTTVCGAVRLSVTVTGTEALSGRPLGPLTGETLPVGIYAAPASVRFIRDHDSAPCKSDVTVGVIVEDGCGNAVPGQAVDFSVESGGATPPACSVVTDAAGKASYTMRLGLDAGPNRVKARVRTTGQSATGVVTSELPPGALVEPGAALDRNVFTPTRGESVLVRVLPVNDEPVVVRVYTASGRLVRTLRSLQPVGGGRWSVSWNGLTEDEFVTTPGVYLVKLSGGGLHDTLKVVVH
jgi:adhesin/invasin